MPEGDRGVKKSIYQSPWLPVSLLVVTTAAMGFPIILLRRAKRNPLPAAPPRRSTPPGRVLNGVTSPTAPVPTTQARVVSAAAVNHSSSDVPPPRRVVRSALTPLGPGAPATLASKPIASVITPETPNPAIEEDAKDTAPKAPLDFNVAFYAFRAFTVATLAVGAGAAVSVVGIKYYLGIKNTEEFAYWARRGFATQLPWLYSRMRRPIIPDAEAEPLAETWSWEGAEQRMSDAWQQQGLIGWAETAAREIEAESRTERAKDLDRMPT